MLCVPSARHLFGTASLASSALSASAELLVYYPTVILQNLHCYCGCEGITNFSITVSLSVIYTVTDVTFQILCGSFEVCSR